jgi:hypothetical protein
MRERPCAAAAVLIRSAAFFPIMVFGAWVLPQTVVGMADVSTTDASINKSALFSPCTNGARKVGTAD